MSTRDEKHTPGPWFFARSKHPVDGEYDYAISAAGVPVISEAFGRSADGGHPPAEANARLIAAAPELLEALRECVWLLADIQPSAGLVQQKARAALAKAGAS